ncbi:MAG: LysM peptidoglycan-binding domain-containing protein [Gammaproteobacteria bacterium]
MNLQSAHGDRNSRKVTRRVTSLVLLSSLYALIGVTPAQAQSVALAPGHAQTYTVVPGDTLWDISGRFLRNPWQWPAVWKANPHIRNPHLIYPGDQVYLSYADGLPQLKVRRGRGATVKLSPKVRSSPVDATRPTIPIDAIQPFLVMPTVMSEEALDAAPYVMSTGRESLVGDPDSNIYVRGLSPGETRFTVLRRSRPYVVVQPDGSEKTLGIEALQVADASLIEYGDPSTLLVTSGRREILEGDVLVPVSQELTPSRFEPRPPPGDLSGSIIAVVNGVTQIGQHMLVVLDLGRRDGLEQGHVMEIFQTGGVAVDERAKPPRNERLEGIRAKQGPELDPAKQGGIEGLFWAMDDVVTLTSSAIGEELAKFDPEPKPYQLVDMPDQRAGLVMVVQPHEDMSFALVMDATRAVHLLDRVRTP